MALVSIVHFNGGKETGRCCLTFMKHFDLCFDTSMGSFSEEAVALVWYRDCDKHSSVLFEHDDVAAGLWLSLCWRSCRAL